MRSGGRRCYTEDDIFIRQGRRKLIRQMKDEADWPGEGETATRKNHMQGSSLLTEISLSYNQYTKTERKIADYILKKPGGVLFMSITELAEECGVAEASIHRFCRKVGAKGYQEFKMKLSLSTTPEEPESDEGSADGNGKVATGQMFADILQTHINAIRETNALLRPETVNAAVDLMIRSRSVQFFGIGDSLLAAEEARNKFLRITPKAEDLLFFISYSGATKDNVYVAKIAKEAGARIIVITRFLKSPLTEYADVVLICGSNEGPLEGGSMGAKMSQLHIIDILFQAYYQKTRRESAENNRRTSKAVVEKLF